MRQPGPFPKRCTQFGIAVLLISSTTLADEPKFVVRKLGVSFPQKDPTQTVYEFANYASNRGPNMFRVRFEELKDDIFSNFELAVSGDHGQTWTDTQQWKSVKPRPDGQQRRLFIYGSFFDPRNGRLLLMGNEGVLRNDHPLDGQTNNYPIYRVSNDGGRTWLFEERVIQIGECALLNEWQDVKSPTKSKMMSDVAEVILHKSWREKLEYIVAVQES